MRLPHVLSAAALASLSAAQCPLYQQYSSQKHEPFSPGVHNLSFARPIPACRTFVSPEVEAEIERLRSVVVDPDLFRLFENTWPSTLDTTIAWRGWTNATTPATEIGISTAEDSKEEEEAQELTFVITGDINAMWLRDSANQLLAYTRLLTPSPHPDSLAALFRGAITLQARYIQSNPWCNAFQAPAESGVLRSSSMNSDRITPAFDYYAVFSCQWELDSVASFLQLSAEYAEKTGDYGFFGRGNWTKAVEKVLHVAESMTMDSYDEEGNWQRTPYTYCVSILARVVER
jgi:meiotically up-regulated gene 157 (Mug157) protein